VPSDVSAYLGHLGLLRGHDWHGDDEGVVLSARAAADVALAMTEHGGGEAIAELARVRRVQVESEPGDALNTMDFGVWVQRLGNDLQRLGRKMLGLP
jgi:hypothetical protein